MRDKDHNGYTPDMPETWLRQRDALRAARQGIPYAIPGQNVHNVPGGPAFEEAAERAHLIYIPGFGHSPTQDWDDMVRQTEARHRARVGLPPVGFMGILVIAATLLGVIVWKMVWR